VACDWQKVSTLPRSTGNPVLVFKSGGRDAEAVGRKAAAAWVVLTAQHLLLVEDGEFALDSPL
jgi:hypothetical protein